MANITLRSLRILLARRAVLWFCALLGLCFPLQSPAHICGPPTRIVRPGDLFYYYILSDVIEVSPSDYQLGTVNDPAIALAYPAGPFSAYYYGEFELEALQQGVTDASFHWA